jgi:superoxide dismutase, Fe-Mn family
MARYELPGLKYDYGALRPFLSEQQLMIHHQKHHQAYVNSANAIFEKLEKARKDGTDLDMKAISKELSFNVAGHLLHSLFWENLAPSSVKLNESLLKAIESEFGSLERFKKEFTQTALSVEGSGWAALVYDSDLKKLLIMQIEKHNLNVIPCFKILLVVDVFEHAYYLDYKNDRAKFLEGFWNNVNWDSVEKRLKQAL